MKKKEIAQYEDAVRDVLRKLENSSKLLDDYFFKTDMKFYNSPEWWGKILCSRSLELRSPKTNIKLYLSTLMGL